MYVQCLSNRPYLHPPEQPKQTEPLVPLTVGKVYKMVADAIAESHDMIRVIDDSYGEAGSGEGYLYPADYFEPFTPDDANRRTASITVHVDAYMKGVLDAEATASDKSVSSLVYDWLEEHLDLPAPA